MILSPGDRVDRYEVVQFLGSGGMGEVYRARDPKLQRQIALKVLRADKSVPTDGRERLLREARAVATISHPNVLSVFDVGELAEPEHLRGVAYIAMELVVGSALRAHVGDRSIPLERRLGWLRDIARALSAAHGDGLVHRDVKPENVMIRFDGIVKVLDFGVARTLAPVDALVSTAAHSLPTLNTAPSSSGGGAPSGDPSATAPGRVVGTLCYMAPEQLRGEAVDGRADQFAWGVVAYELLLGEAPWTLSADAIAIASQILSRPVRPPSEFDPSIPREVSDAILRALSKDPAARFSSMGDLLSSFDTRGRSARSITRAGRASRRAWAIGGAVLVTLGASVLVTTRSGPASPGRPSVGTDSATSIAPGGCTSSAACSRAHGGGAWRCQSARHECVEITSPDCKALAQPADFTNDGTVWIGGLYPTTGPEAEGFASEARALDLARQDFASALGAAGSGATRARPIGVVLCDEAVDPLRAARHLAGEVQVPAVVGFRSAQAALSIIPTALLPEHIASLITISQAPALTRIPESPAEPRLIWRVTLDSKDTAAPLGALVSDVLEPRARGQTRVAFVRRGSDVYDAADEIFRTLRFNGKSALENGDDFRQYVLDESTDGGGAAVVEGLLAFRPQVIFAGGMRFATRVLRPLEERWGAGQRPYYLINSGEFGDEFKSFVGRDPERRRRFFGVTNMSTRMTNAQLVLRYNRAFPGEPVTRTIAPQPSYDAFYLLAYATLSLGDDPVTGPALSRAMDRLRPPGPKIDVGPQDIYDAFSALRTGQRVDLNGAIGDLDFNPATGEAPIDYAIVCLDVDDHGVASGTIESGLVYDAAARKLRGTLRCP